MANTTYDQLYTSFIRNAHVPNADLPSDDAGRYILIQSAVGMYNTEILDDNGEITADDSTETLSAELVKERLLLLTWYMKKIVISGSHEYKTTLNVPFSKEIGKRFVNSQITGGRQLLDRIDLEISRLILLTDTSEEY